MKSVYVLFSLVCIGILSAWTEPVQIPAGTTADTLYPPRNLNAWPVECSTYLFWSPPLRPDSMIPPGIVGYYVYGNGHLLNYQAGLNDTLFYHIDFKPGPWAYKVTAYYDLSYYGQPGLYAESPFSNEAVIEGAGCPAILPFSEPWDHSSFSFQDWRFVPDPGNWVIDNQHGMPGPSAVFEGNPVLTGYYSALVSTWMWLTPYSCATVSLTFDLRLENVNPTGLEKIIIEATPDSTLHPIATLTNILDTGWIHYEYNLNEYLGEMIQFRFRATGANSQDIVAWYLDNIRLEASCLPPTGCKAIRYGDDNIIRLSWTPPCSNSPKRSDLIRKQTGNSLIYGYNIYRTDSSGMPPFMKLNTASGNDTVYYDTIPSSLLSGHFAYYMTTIFNDTSSHSLLCESYPCDTLSVTKLSVNEKEEPGILVYPNPTSGEIIIKGAITIMGCEIWNTAGQRVNLIRSNNSNELKINIRELAPGLFFLKIQTGNGIVTRKLIR